MNVVNEILAGKVVLFLYAEQITDDDVCALAKALKHPNCKLEQLGVITKLQISVFVPWLMP